MPKDNIERAIAKGTGADADADAFESVLYEGYGPGGVAILVEALTDNRNRTGSEVRHAFTKHGGNLGEPGSVAWTFEKKGELVVDGSRYSEDDLLRGDRRRRRGRGARRRRLGDRHRPADVRRCARRSRRPGVEIESAELVQRPTTRTPVEEDRVRHADAPDRGTRGPRRRAGGARQLRRRRRRARAGGGGLMRPRRGHGASSWPRSGSSPGTMHFVIPRSLRGDHAAAARALEARARRGRAASPRSRAAWPCCPSARAARRALVAAGDARGDLPGQHQHGGERAGLPRRSRQPLLWARLPLSRSCSAG